LFLQRSFFSRYQGYVLDGFPRSVEECRELFLEKKPDSEDEEEPADVEEPGKQKEPIPDKLDSRVAPGYIVELIADEEHCM
jgi:hypothetical protein